MLKVRQPFNIWMEMCRFFIDTNFVDWWLTWSLFKSHQQFEIIQYEKLNVLFNISNYYQMSPSGGSVEPEHLTFLSAKQWLKAVDWEDCIQNSLVICRLCRCTELPQPLGGPHAAISATTYSTVQKSWATSEFFIFFLQGARRLSESLE